jgi:Peptidase M50B-like
MSQAVDKTINLLKWPTAIFFLFLLPGSIFAFKDIGVGFYKNYKLMIPFLTGFGGYWAVWYFILSSRLFGSSLSTLEHELTHGFFALLTGHKVWGIRTSWNSGGKINYSPPGNWLITIAPYFFPTISFIIMAILMIFLPMGRIASMIFGISISYHITSTMRETHLEQTDLQKAGYLFSLVFLPAANILSYGILLSYTLAGWSGSSYYLKESFSRSLSFIGM